MEKIGADINKIKNDLFDIKIELKKIYGQMNKLVQCSKEQK